MEEFRAIRFGVIVDDAARHANKLHELRRSENPVDETLPARTNVKFSEEHKRKALSLIKPEY